jgi:hypothetical protein
LWVARYEGPAGDLDAGNAISASPDGTTVAITGYATSTDTSGDLVTIAYDSANGTRRWISSYDGPQHSWDEGRGIAISPDDSTVVVTGYSLTIGAVSDYVTLAHDLDDGSQLWSARYNGTGVGHDVAEVVQLSPDGSRVFITGSSKGEGITDDYATLSYATRTGVQQWASRYNGPADSLDFADALVVSADGSLVYVTGGSTGIGTNLDYATIVYRAGSGRQLQVIRQGRDGADAGIDVGVSSDGSQLFVTGVVQDKLGQTFYGTLAYGL